jgi:glycerophosphoryl diester phosphodiesterase
MTARALLARCGVYGDETYLFVPIALSLALVPTSPLLFAHPFVLPLVSVHARALLVSCLLNINLLVAAYFIARTAYTRGRLPRGPSVASWATGVLAHRGYRSQAQMANKVFLEDALTTSKQVEVPTSDTLGVDIAAGEVPTVGVRSRSSSRAGLVVSSSMIAEDGYNIPENSMLAFIYAHESGTHGIEVDVSLTRDGEILVMHDNTLQRTMVGEGEVCALTLAEIQRMAFRRVTPHEYTIRLAMNRTIDTTRAPTLEDVILFCRARSLRLMVETKEFADHHLLRSKIAALYAKYNMYSWSFVATFDPTQLYYYRREHPTIATCLLYCRDCIEWYHVDGSREMKLPWLLDVSPVRAGLDWCLYYFSPTLIADYLGVSIVGPHNVLVSPALIASLKARDIVCDVWVVNDEKEKEWLKSQGCIVTTDRLFSFDDLNPFETIEAVEKKERATLNIDAISAGSVTPLPSPQAATLTTTIIPATPPRDASAFEDAVLVDADERVSGNETELHRRK